MAANSPATPWKPSSLPLVRSATEAPRQKAFAPCSLCLERYSILSQALPRARFSDAPTLQPNRELQDVPADRVADLYGHRGVGKLPCVPRVLEMLQHRSAVHARSIPVLLPPRNTATRNSQSEEKAFQHKAARSTASR